jgi:hypothetical protein
MDGLKLASLQPSADSWVALGALGLNWVKPGGGGSTSKLPALPKLSIEESRLSRPQL